MRRFLTLKLVVAGLVCLAAASAQDAAPLTEQPLAADTTATETGLAAPEPINTNNEATEPIPPVEEGEAQNMAAPEEEEGAEPVTDVAPEEGGEEEKALDGGATGEEPVPEGEVVEPPMDGEPETMAGQEPEEGAEKVVEPPMEGEETNMAGEEEPTEQQVEETGATEGGEPMEPEGMPEEPMPEETDKAEATEGGGAGAEAVDGAGALGGTDALAQAGQVASDVTGTVLENLPQEDIDPAQMGDALGQTTAGGNLNEAVYETVTDMAGGALDGASGNVGDGSLLDTAQTVGDGVATGNNVLANAGGSNGGAGVLNGIDGALPGGGNLLNGVGLGNANQPVAPSTTTGGSTTGAAAGGDTVVAAPGGDKAEADAGADAGAAAFPEHLYITSFQCDVDEVLVTEQDNYVTCTVTAESSAGVSSIAAAFYNPPMNKRFLMSFGEDELVEGDAKKGTWSVDLTVPKGADQGVWQLGFSDEGAFYGLEVVDAKGNVVNYAKPEAVKTITPLQQQLTVQSYKGNTVAYPQANIVSSSGLKLYGLACDLAAVDVTSAPADVPCSALVVPDEAGLGKVLAYLVGPTGKTVLPLTFDETAERLLIPATNTTEEMFQLAGKLSVPTWAEPGAYALADSGAFQPRTMSHAGTLRLASPEMLARKPRLQVIAANDKAAPRVSNFYCNQGQKVDLSNKESVAVNCLLRASDDLSGISYAAMHFVSPSKLDAVEFAFVPPSPGLGPFPNVAVPNVAETVSAQFPPATEPGAWTLARAVVADQSGNYKEYTATELDQLNVQTFFLVQGNSRTFNIEARPGSDKQAPAAPGTATSAAPAGSRPSALILTAGALLSAVLGLAAVAL